MVNQILDYTSAPMVLGGLWLTMAANRTGYLVAAIGYVMISLAEAGDHMYWGAAGFAATAARMLYLWRKDGGSGGIRLSLASRRRTPKVVLT